MEVVHGIKYSKPEVLLLQDTGIGVAELAARTCYDSFENSENWCVRELNNFIKNGDEDIYELPVDVSGGMVQGQLLSEVNDINSSGLLEDLAHTYFHHSILEHANLSFLVRGTSRGVLQEHARHRIQAISVRSTRYTMSGIINAFVASTTTKLNGAKPFFVRKIIEMEMFVTNDKRYNEIEAGGMYDKLHYQLLTLGTEGFMKISVAKSSLHYLETTEEEFTPNAIFELLQAGKKKRNVGDAFKHIISDNVKVDMVVTFNVRSLKNYFDLRDSGAAFFQIRWLAQAMKEVTPSKYLDLIEKRKK